MPSLKRSVTYNASQDAPSRTYKRSRTGLSSAVRYKRAANAKALRTQVKKIVGNLAEKKHATFNQNAAPVSNYNYTGFSSQIVPVSPMNTFIQISQGTSQDERIGNRIRTAKCNFKAIMWPTIYNATTNPFPAPHQVRFVVFSVKGDTSAVPTALPNFFQNGSSTSPPNGDLGDMIDTINTDEYTVYKDFTVKLGYQSFDATPGGGGNAGWFANNDFHFNHTVDIDVTKHLPSVITFNDNNSAPTSRAVFVTWFAAHAGGSAGTSTLRPADMDYSIDFKYTDD